MWVRNSSYILRWADFLIDGVLSLIGWVFGLILLFWFRMLILANKCGQSFVNFQVKFPGHPFRAVFFSFHLICNIGHNWNQVKINFNKCPLFSKCILIKFVLQVCIDMSRVELHGWCAWSSQTNGCVMWRVQLAF